MLVTVIVVLLNSFSLWCSEIASILLISSAQLIGSIDFVERLLSGSHFVLFGISFMTQRNVRPRNLDWHIDL